MLPYSLPVESRKALQHFGCQENFFQGSAVMTWMGFAITFVARPFGGIVLGLLGDIFGRKAQPGIGMDEVTSKYCIYLYIQESKRWTCWFKLLYMFLFFYCFFSCFAFINRSFPPDRSLPFCPFLECFVVPCFKASFPRTSMGKLLAL